MHGYCKGSQDMAEEDIMFKIVIQCHYIVDSQFCQQSKNTKMSKQRPIQLTLAACSSCEKKTTRLYCSTHSRLILCFLSCSCYEGWCRVVPILYVDHHLCTCMYR